MRFARRFLRRYHAKLQNQQTIATRPSYGLAKGPLRSSACRVPARVLTRNHSITIVFECLDVSLLHSSGRSLAKREVPGVYKKMPNPSRQIPKFWLGSRLRVPFLACGTCGICGYGRYPCGTAVRICVPWDKSRGEMPSQRQEGKKLVLGFDRMSSACGPSK